MHQYTDCYACPHCHWHEPYDSSPERAEDPRQEQLDNALNHIAGRTAEGFLTGLFEVLARKIRGDR